VSVVLSKQISFFYLYNKKLFMLLNVSLYLERKVHGNVCDFLLVLSL